MKGRKKGEGKLNGVGHSCGRGGVSEEDANEAETFAQAAPTTRMQPSTGERKNPLSHTTAAAATVVPVEARRTKSQTSSVGIEGPGAGRRRSSRSKGGGACDATAVVVAGGTNNIKQTICGVTNSSSERRSVAGLRPDASRVGTTARRRRLPEANIAPVKQIFTKDFPEEEKSTSEGENDWEFADAAASFSTDDESQDQEQGIECELHTLLLAPATALSKSPQYPGRTQPNPTARLPSLGMINLGNTCYLNSAVQMLLSLPLFVEDLCTHDYEKSFHRSANSLRDLYTHVTLLPPTVDNCVTVTSAEGGISGTMAKKKKKKKNGLPPRVPDADRKGRNSPQMQEVKPQQLQQQHQQILLIEARDTLLASSNYDSGTDTTETISSASCGSRSEDDGCERVVGTKKAKSGPLASPLLHALAELSIRLNRFQAPFSPDLLHAGDTHYHLGTDQKTYDYDTENGMDMMIGKGGAVDPAPLKRVVDSQTEQFHGYKQQDAHEFLTSLIDLLHEELLEVHQRDRRRKRYESSRKRKTKREVAAAVSGNEGTVLHRESFVHQGRSAMDSNSAGLLPYHSRQNLKSPPSPVPVLPSEADEEFATWRTCGMFSIFYDAIDCSNLSPTPFVNRYNNIEMEVSKHGVAGESAVVAPVNAFESDEHVSESLDSLIAEKGDYELLQTEDATNSNDYDGFVNIPSIPLFNVGEAIKNGDYVEDDIVESDEERDAPPPPLPTDHFRMEISVKLVCDNADCSFSRTRTEMYRHLSLEVSSTVADAFAKFFSPERRDLFCEQCGCMTATQYMEIVTLPRALILHLKRFVIEFDRKNCDLKVNKDGSKVGFGETISLGQYCSCEADRFTVGVGVATADRTCRIKGNTSLSFASPAARLANYRLNAVVHHLGDSVSSGHYVADTVASLPGGPLLTQVAHSSCTAAEGASCSGGTSWLRFNDDIVTTVSFQDVAGGDSRGTAYMFMYELDYKGAGDINREQDGLLQGNGRIWHFPRWIIKILRKLYHASSSSSRFHSSANADGK